MLFEYIFILIIQEPAVKRMKLEVDEDQKGVKMETEEDSNIGDTIIEAKKEVDGTEVKPVIEESVIEEKPAEVPPAIPIVTTPTRGRGGGRGRGGRGGVARRGPRR